MLRPLVIIQPKPTQFDTPLFEQLVHLGVDLTVVYEQTDQPVDPELGSAPDFDNSLDNYAWTRKVPKFPKGAHVIVSGWADPRAWRGLLSRMTGQVTSGVRFDTIEPSRASRKAIRQLSVWRQIAALRTADVWHPVGTESFNYAQRVSRGKPKPRVDIPYAVDLRRFEVPAKGRAEAESRALTVLVVAKLNNREGVDTVIQALTGMAGTRLIVVGDGPDRNKLELMARDAAVNAEFAGYVRYSELPRYFAKSDVFVHAARVEPWGVSVHEAMAAGLPVLASTTVGAARELLPGDSTEWGFDPGDTRRLGELVVGLRNHRRRSHLGSMNSRASHQISPEITAQSLVRYLGL